jgi:hypothetical protein
VAHSRAIDRTGDTTMTATPETTAAAETTPTATPEHAPAAARRSDAEAWARPVDRLTVDAGAEGLASTVVGKRLAGPLHGFGQMWQKTFRVRVPAAIGLTPESVVATWKAEFPSFWPKGNQFYAPLAGIQPGEVALLSVEAAGPVKLHTGVLVLYADDQAFTLMTPEGHMLAAWITFSASPAADGSIVLQAQALERASDPIFEFGLVLGGHGVNNRFWEATLRNLAMRLGVAEAVVEREVVCVDRRRQWRYVRNVRHNAGIKSALHAANAPLRLLRRRI